MLIGYARTSTIDQEAGLEAQLRDLRQAGCEKVFQEKVSSVATRRDQLEAALDFIREGDTLVVTKLDRLGRSVRDVLALKQQITAKGGALRILALGLDTASPTGNLILQTLAAVAEFEREIMLERQREGIAKAKAEGRYRGRKPTAMAKADEVKALRVEGVSPTEIAKRLGIGRASVYRALQA